METIYSKYNFKRKPRFQISTHIVVSFSNEKFVIKKALTQEAKEYINILHDNYRLLRENFDEKIFLPKIIDKTDSFIKFEYIEGDSLAKKLLQAFFQKDKNQYLSIIINFRDILLNSTKRAKNTSDSTPDDFFGETKIHFPQDQPLMSHICCVDANFDNIIINKNNYYLIDNEWIFRKNFPAIFPVIRGIRLFYDKYCEFGLEIFFPIKQLFEKLNLNIEWMDIADFLGTMLPNYVNEGEKLAVQKINPKFLPMFTDYATLYVNTGEGYSGKQAICMAISTLENEIRFDLKDYKNIKQLRFDPTSSPAAVRIDRIEIIDNKGERTVIGNYESNAFSTANGNLVFNTEDPQIFITEIENIPNPRKIIIKLKYIDTNSGIPTLEKKTAKIKASLSYKVGRFLTSPLVNCRKQIDKSISSDIYKEIETIEQSASYRLGRIATFPARIIFDLIVYSKVSIRKLIWKLKNKLIDLRASIRKLIWKLKNNLQIYAYKFNYSYEIKYFFRYASNYFQKLWHTVLNKSNIDDVRIAVVAHIFYEDMVEEFANYFKNIPVKFDLFISTKPEAEEKIYKFFVKHFDKDRVSVRGVENIGVDIAPFICEFKNEYLQYDLICKVHGKKSNRYKLYLPESEKWRKYLLDNLLGSTKIVRTIISCFIKHKNVGIIFPDYFPPIKNWIQWGNNFKKAEIIARKLNINIGDIKKPEFPAGSMFWFRPQALKSLFDAGFKFNDFESSIPSVGSDGTFMHAMERLFVYISAKNGFSYKKIIFKRYIPRKTSYKNLKIAVVSHIFYEDIAEELLEYYKNIPVKFDLFITTKTEAEENLFKLFSTHFGKKRVFIKTVENIGTDIAPFICEFKDEYPKYDLICKVHSKKSLHHGPDCTCRNYLLENLLGSKETIKKIINIFQRDHKMGMVFPKICSEVEQCYNWGNNWNNCINLGAKLGLEFNKTDKIDFPAGSMFWFRPDAIKSLFELGLKFDDFESSTSAIGSDGTLMHAIERLFALIAIKHGYKYGKIPTTDH